MQKLGSQINYASLKLKVGIELHRQLSVGGKLFCGCSPEREEGTKHFVRYLRPSESELGEIDPAARFEAAKGLEIHYLYGDKSSCLVEADEEPPHDVNKSALRAALIIALMLNANVVDEIHVMRKIVVDGSNTTGFQRTMLIALGGKLRAGNRSVGVQTITLEEDAARIVESRSGLRVFSLDRLGIPLVEISLEPIDVKDSPEEVVEVAASLGRLLKSTGMVARGIGTVRQDLNISIEGSGIVEVKGVQELPLIAKIVDFEAKRLYWLKQLSAKLRERGITKNNAVNGPVDVTRVLSEVKTGFIKKQLSRGAVALAILARGYRGLIGYEPYPDVRVGRDLAEIAKLFGLGGVIHSDELPRYGITSDIVGKILVELGARREDAFVIVVGDRQRVESALEMISARLRELVDGPPAETRAPTPDGKTRYLRPRPGAARMYPETDVPLITVTRKELEELKKNLPAPWEEQVKELSSKYGLPEKLAEELLDSEYYNVFLKAVSIGVKPTIAAVTVVETLKSLRREGLDVGRISEEALVEVLGKVAEGIIAKEAIPEILEKIAKGDAETVSEAIKQLGISRLTDEELRSIIVSTIEKNMELVLERGERAFGPLMGEVMKIVRGKIDGSKVSLLLREELKKRLSNR